MQEAVLKCVSGNDAAVVRSLLATGVFSSDPVVSMPLLEALIDIITARGRMHELIASVLSIEFVRDEQEPSTVLRSNTQVTRFMRAFVLRYGKS